MKDLLTVRAGDTVRVPIYFEVSTRIELRGTVSALRVSSLPCSSGTWARAPSRGPEVGVWTPNLGSRPSAGCSYIPRPWPAALERGLLEGLRDAGWEGSFPCDPEAHRLSSFARKIGRASSEGPRCGLNGALRLDLFKNHIEMLGSGLRC